MKTSLLTALLASVIGCGSSSSPSTTMPAPAPAPDTVAPAPAPAPPSNKPKPEYGTWGFDATGMDKQVAPGQSFFQYADGTWIKRTPMPEDKSNYGLFTLLNDKSNERLKAILEAASGDPDSNGQRIGDYYKTFMDEAAIEQLGAKPIQPMLAEIAKIGDTRGLMLAFARGSRRLDFSMPFATGVGQDDREPDKYIAGISQGGLGLADRDMYDAKNAQFEAMRGGYKKYLAQLFTLIGQKDGEKRAAAVYALEEKIAAAHWTQIQNRDPVKTYNKLTIAELTKLAPDVDWKAWLKAVGLEGQPAVLVAQPPVIAATAKLVKTQPLAVWKDFLTVHAVNASSPYLSKAFVDAHFEMFGKISTGTPQLEARWKRGVTQVDRGMGEAAGQAYVAKYFPPETKAAADKLVKNILVAMGQRLDGLTWMGADTKARAKAKLATYNPKIGYPAKWRDYTGLKVVA
ncbi:MAG TPA: M13 family metallopeptidase N-terminal domain-containing protein, partial [Kofleriaceae bacterium]